MSALEVLKAGLENDPENDSLINLMEETKQEYEEDTKLPSDHPERKRFQNLIDWLKEGGAKFDKLKMRFYTEDFRGVHAARDI